VITELDTERLRLRQFCERDHADFARNHADPEMTRFLGGPVTEARSWGWLLYMLGHWTIRGFGYFALELKASGAIVGAAGLSRDFDWPETELGWRLFPAHQGRGYATEAARRIREFTYDNLGATTLVSYIDPGNAASIRVAERLGARPDGEIVLRGDRSIVYRHPYPLN
jgi:RimJ/RimL family protein N-acetyltransferase